MHEHGAAEVGYNGPVIDSHHHVWDLGRNLHPWLTPEGRVAHRYGDYSAIKHDYLASDFLTDIAGTRVEASVYMEAEWDPTDAIGEVAYIRELSASSGVPGAMAAQAWLNAPDLAEMLSAYVDSGIVRSVRHKPGGPATPEAVGREHTLMSDDSWRTGYALLEEHGLHFELQTPWWNLPEAVDLARDFPSTTLVINHSGVLLDREPATVSAWRKAVEEAAAMPNTVIKASGLCVEGTPWTVDLNRDVVLALIEAFGAERVMFGSNFPVDGMFTTYRGLLDGYREITQGLTAADQRAFFHDTAARVYRPTPMSHDSVL